MAELRYKFNPYTFARISAMKSLLLQKADYDRIMKLEMSEIIKFMQEGVYAEEINRYSMRYSGLKLVETSLNKHLERIFLKLKIISDPSIGLLMVQYLKRYDFWNIKTMLRAKVTHVPEEELIEMLLPVGSLKLEKLKKLYKLNVREIISQSGLVDYSKFEEAIAKFEQTKDLSQIENLLDHHYYHDTLEFSHLIPKQGKLFKEFFTYEFDIYNIKLLLRRMFFDLHKKEVQPFILKGGKNLNRHIVLELLNAHDIHSFLKVLSKTSYRKVLPDFKDEKNLLMKSEILLERFLLERSLLLYHQHPLTVDVVLGYMFAKEIEVRNLRVIIKSKKLEFTEDFVKNLIVVK